MISGKSGNAKVMAIISSSLFSMIWLNGCFEYSMPSRQNISIDLDLRKVEVIEENLQPMYKDSIEKGMDEIAKAFRSIKDDGTEIGIDTAEGFVIKKYHNISIDKNGKINYVFGNRISQDSSKLHGDFFAKWVLAKPAISSLVPLVVIHNGEVIIHAKPINYEIPDSLYAVESEWPLLRTNRNTFIVCPDSVRTIKYSIVFRTDKIAPHSMKYDIDMLKKKIQK